MAFWKKIFQSRGKEELRKSKPQERNSGAVEPVVEEALTGATGAPQSSAASTGGVVLLPRVTEKSSAGAKRGEYTFVIDRAINKIQARRAIEQHYRVHAQSLRIVNLPPKRRTRGKIVGWKPGLKKAIVRVRTGEAIEVQ